MPSTLLNTQGDSEPIDYTHFDQWITDPTDPDADIYAVAKEAQRIIATWEATLECSLDGFVGDSFGGSYEQAMLSLGFDLFMDLILMNVLRAGYDVYCGSEFVEIYKGENHEN